jgi:hypothetical protein
MTEWYERLMKLKNDLVYGNIIGSFAVGFSAACGGIESNPIRDYEGRDSKKGHETQENRS